jgi:hypothetical protein
MSTTVVVLVLLVALCSTLVTSTGTSSVTTELKFCSLELTRFCKLQPLIQCSQCTALAALLAS